MNHRGRRKAHLTPSHPPCPGVTRFGPPGAAAGPGLVAAAAAKDDDGAVAAAAAALAALAAAAASSPGRDGTSLRFGLHDVRPSVRPSVCGSLSSSSRRALELRDSENLFGAPARSSRDRDG